MKEGLSIRVLSLLLLIAIVLAACQADGAVTVPASGATDLQTQNIPVEGGGSYTDLNASGLAAMLENKDFPLINVHIPYEGEIAETDLFIAYNEVEANLEKLPLDKGAGLVLYCRSGGMSAIAARELVKRGYTNVWNLDGGMIAWRQAGYPLLNKSN